MKKGFDRPIWLEDCLGFCQELGEDYLKLSLGLVIALLPPCIVMILLCCIFLLANINPILALLALGIIIGAVFLIIRSVAT